MLGDGSPPDPAAGSPAIDLAHHVTLLLVAAGFVEPTWRQAFW
jgi:hypothetical protein